MFNVSAIQDKFRRNLIKIAMDVIAVVFAGLGWYYGVIRNNKSVALLSASQELIEKFERRDEVKERKIDSLLKIHLAQQKIINSLVNTNISNHSDWDDFELPMWEKELIKGQWVVTYVNPAYVDEFLYGRSRYDLIGGTGYLVFPNSVPLVYQKNDWDASRSKKVKVYAEPYVRKDGTIGKMESLKFRRWWITDRRVLIGIALRKLD